MVDEAKDVPADDEVIVDDSDVDRILAEETQSGSGFKNENELPEEDFEGFEDDVEREED